MGLVYLPAFTITSWPLVGNEGMNPQYTNVKVDSLIPYESGQPDKNQANVGKHTTLVIFQPIFLGESDP